MRSDWKINQQLLTFIIFASCLFMCIILACSGKNDNDAIVNVALQMAQAAKDEYQKNQSFRSIAMHFAGIGEYARAIETTALIADTSEKATALYAIAIFYLEDAQYEQALHLAEIIEELRLRIWVACLTASEYIEEGNVDRALAILRQSLELTATIEDDLDKSEALARIADAYADAGEREEALQLLNQALQIIESRKAAGYEWSERSVLVTMAEKYAKLGEMDRASMALNKVKQKILELKGDNSEYLKLLELWYVALAYARFGQCEEALKVAELMKDIEPRGRVTVEVVAAFVKKGEYKRAQGLIKKIKHPPSRNNALVEVIRGYAREGYYDKAQNFIKELDGASYRAKVLTFLSTKHKTAGHDSLAVDLLSQAHESAEQVQEPMSKAFALMDVARGYAEIEQNDNVLKIQLQVQQVAMIIQDTHERDMILNLLAWKLAELGQYNQSLQITKMISGTREKVSALVYIAGKYHESGRKPDSQAKRILKEMIRVTED